MNNTIKIDGDQTFVLR